MGGCFQDVLFGFAAPVRIEKQGLGGNCHWDRPVDLLEEVVDDGC